MWKRKIDLLPWERTSVTRERETFFNEGDSFLKPDKECDFVTRAREGFCNEREIKICNERTRAFEMREGEGFYNERESFW